ncbi:MAG TPA: IscA/HesB family protein [Deltaproteobacteria bacterium]|nr:IscA/HesB family protein [Deltaproteobacteria bacterium]HOM29168.1 IscA/HesB family protein [Deltaproteobacteria bacterium]HPP80433.1 IscA/HesB family protein [Deltaproteobacteria bacterium]
MLEVTRKATEMIGQFFKGREKVEPVRVFVAGMGCSGVQLGMALDEANENDRTFEIDGYTYLIENQLYETAKPIKIDYVTTSQGEGFVISSSLKPGSGCSGGCCGC